jgi:hypothetical protein
MKWIIPEGNFRLRMKFTAPWVGSSTVDGMRRLRRDLGSNCIRTQRTGDRIDIMVDKAFEDDVEIEYRLDELWNEMARFEHWERISYSFDRM